MIFNLDFSRIIYQFKTFFGLIFNRKNITFFNVLWFFVANKFQIKIVVRVNSPNDIGIKYRTILSTAVYRNHTFIVIWHKFPLTIFKTFGISYTKRFYIISFRISNRG